MRAQESGRILCGLRRRRWGSWADACFMHATPCPVVVSSRPPGSTRLGFRLLPAPRDCQAEDFNDAQLLAIARWGNSSFTCIVLWCNFRYRSLRSVMLILVTWHYFKQLCFRLSENLDEVWIMDYYTLHPCYTPIPVSRTSLPTGKSHARFGSRRLYFICLLVCSTTNTKFSTDSFYHSLAWCAQGRGADYLFYEFYWCLQMWQHDKVASAVTGRKFSTFACLANDWNFDTCIVHSLIQYEMIISAFLIMCRLLRQL
jgi:hypothetical protein